MKHLRPLHLDFITQSGWAKNPLGNLLLALGVLCCIAVAFAYTEVNDATEALKYQKDVLERKIARRSPEPSVATAERNEAELASAAIAFQRPWDSLLQDLEGSVDDSVALLSLEPDPLQKQVLISGESRRLEDILAFINRLGETQSLQRPTLISHQSRQGNSGPVIGFSIQAGWREAP